MNGECAVPSQVAVRDSDAILQVIKEDGSFDQLKQKVLERLREDDELYQFTKQLVFNSDRLNAPDAARQLQAKRATVIDGLKQELEKEVMAKISEACWKILGPDDSDMAREVDNKIYAAMLKIQGESSARSAMQHSMASADAQHRAVAPSMPAMTSATTTMPSAATMTASTRGFEFAPHHGTAAPAPPMHPHSSRFR